MRNVYYEVNAEGRQRISEYLMEFHKNGSKLMYDTEVLHALSAVVEYNIRTTDEALFELEAYHTFSGHAYECWIEEDGFDLRRVN